MGAKIPKDLQVIQDTDRSELHSAGLQQAVPRLRGGITAPHQTGLSDLQTKVRMTS